MPHVLKMKDGKLLTPFGIRDLLDAVQDYAGEELRREIEEYIDTNVQDIDDYEKEYDRMERDSERLADHQRSVLCNIRDHLDCFGRVEFWQLNIFQVLKTSEVRKILYRKGKTDFIELFSIAVGEAITVFH